MFCVSSRAMPCRSAIRNITGLLMQQVIMKLKFQVIIFLFYALIQMLA